MNILKVILACMMVATTFGCASQPAAPVAAAPQADRPADGAELYTLHCSTCHGRLSDTRKPGRRPARIKSAIRQNFGGMSFLSTLSDEDIASIADALLQVSPPKDAGGEALYAMYCDECHRPLADSDIRGKSAGDIAAAIKDKMCNTISLEFLDEGELEKVADALGNTPGVAKPGPETEKPSPVKAAEFDVARFLTCRSISKREPAGVASEFESGTEKVYAFLEAKDIGRNLQVIFIWYLDGVEVGRDKMKLGKGGRWRTYCFRTIDGHAGAWRVEVRSPEGTTAATAEFLVK